MKISEVIRHLEQLAPSSLQEVYDNAGLLTGSADWECTGIICSLDVTEAVVTEAVQKKSNLIVAHHPIIFSGLKKITGQSYVERTIISAIKNDVAIFAIHTNLDNVIEGVNRRMAETIGLIDCRVLLPKEQVLLKLIVFVPVSHEERLKQAMFKAGAGSIGNYSECSFSSTGMGTFKAGDNAKPFVGSIGDRHQENESRLEVILPAYLKAAVLKAMTANHPYEVVAYDLYAMQNTSENFGSGMIGKLPVEMEEFEFLQLLKRVFRLSLIRHTPLTGKKVSTVALCGGAGSFLTKKALSSGADFFVTADVKYHEFFDAEGKMVLADVGHWESEQFTVDLLHDVLVTKFPTFAVQKSEVQTNPVLYFT